MLYQYQLSMDSVPTKDPVSASAAWYRQVPDLEAMVVGQASLVHSQWYRA